MDVRMDVRIDVRTDVHTDVQGTFIKILSLYMLLNVPLHAPTCSGLLLLINDTPNYCQRSVVHCHVRLGPGWVGLGARNACP